MNQNEVEITRLLDLTGHAHHRAFIDTDGHDPDWPIWYADYSIHQIRPLLAGELSKSEYIYALVHLSKIQPLKPQMNHGLNFMPNISCKNITTRRD